MTPSKEAAQVLLLLHRSFKNALLVSILSLFGSVVLATKKRVKFPIARVNSLVKKKKLRYFLTIFVLNALRKHLKGWEHGKADSGANCSFAGFSAFSYCFCCHRGRGGLDQCRVWQILLNISGALSECLSSIKH
jgi:hypothetical protein